MNLTGFVDEELLNEMFTSGDITDLDYVKHHSQEMVDAYSSFIKENNLSDCNDSAARFLKEENGSYGMEMLPEGGQASDDNAESVNVFKEWSAKADRMAILLGGCDAAAEVALWRYNNPTNNDKNACSIETELAEPEVDQWWNTIDFINGSLGGGHISLINPNIKNMKELLADAVQQAFME